MQSLDMAEHSWVSPKGIEIPIPFLAFFFASGGAGGLG